MCREHTCRLLFLRTHGYQYFVWNYIGYFLALLAWVSKQRIGYGDAVIFMVLGMCLEPVRVLGILWISMLMAGVYGIVKIIAFNKSRSLALPYIPFVTIVYVGMLMSGI